MDIGASDAVLGRTITGTGKEVCDFVTEGIWEWTYGIRVRDIFRVSIPLNLPSRSRSRKFS
jgi:hypothetical protein